MNKSFKIKLVIFVCLLVFIVIETGCLINSYVSKKSETDSLIDVQIKQGLIKGSVKQTIHNNVKYYSFLGIPFAKPPIGQLRFKDPEPADSWSGILDGSKEGSSCLQINPITLVISGDEDCLFLNVFTPQISDKNAPKLPVVLFIHGGGFSTGSGSPTIFPPDVFIEEDIIYVSTNYRLGVFGFLCAQIESAPGNAGLKDQVMALKWINENIHNFGGDPNRVTIMGASSGSASVQYHTFSSLSRGFYHKGIMQSGTALISWTMSMYPVGRALHLGRLLHFNSTDLDLLVDYLITLPANKIILPANKINSVSLTRWSLERYNFMEGKTFSVWFGSNMNIIYVNDEECLKIPFIPCVERKGTSNSSFITLDPRTMINSGHFMKVPMLIGIDEIDGAAVMAQNFKTVKSYGRDYTKLIPKTLGLKEGSVEYNEVANEIGEFYFHNQMIDVLHFAEYLIACSDVAVALSYLETIKYLRNSNVTLYAYLFEFEGKLGYLKSKLQESRKDVLQYFPKGTFHNDELGYLFLKANVSDISLEFETSRRLRYFWSNFIKYSDPNGKNTSKYVIWESCTKNDIQYLSINKNLTLVKGTYFPKRMEFWRKIFTKYKPGY